MMKIASFFSGCGGLDLGFEQAGFKIVWANDFNKSIEKTYRVNHPSTNLIIQDIRNFAENEIPDCDGFIGGPPCQSWSVGGKQLGLNDERGKLFLEYIKIINWKKPKFFVIENVEGLILEKHMNTFLGFLKNLRDCGYIIHYEMLNAADFSIPQDRKRVFVVGLREDLDVDFQFPSPHSEKISLRRAIGDICIAPFEYVGAVDEQKHNGRFFNHDVYIGPYDAKFMARNRVRGWDEQSFTIQALAKNCPLHPQAPKMEFINSEKREFVKGKEYLYRRLSIRECARIQTFPDSFKFYYTDIKEGYKMIGNAVPPRLAYHIAISLKNALSARVGNKRNTVLVGYYKDHNHLEAIRRHGIYNIRCGVSSEIFKLPLGDTLPEYLLLHNNNDKFMFKLHNKEPRLVGSEELASLGFNPKHDQYMIFSIKEELTSEESDIFNTNIKLKKGRLGAKPQLLNLCD